MGEARMCKNKCRDNAATADHEGALRGGTNRHSIDTGREQGQKKQSDR